MDLFFLRYFSPTNGLVRWLHSFGLSKKKRHRETRDRDGHRGLCTEQSPLLQADLLNVDILFCNFNKMCTFIWGLTSSLFYNIASFHKTSCRKFSMTLVQLSITEEIK